MSVPVFPQLYPHVERMMLFHKPFFLPTDETDAETETLNFVTNNQVLAFWLTNEIYRLLLKEKVLGKREEETGK